MIKKIPLWQAILVMLATIFNLCYCLGVLGNLFGPSLSCYYGEVHVALIASAVFAGLIGIINGYKWKYLFQGITTTLMRSIPVILILMLVGGLIGTWIQGGIVPTMIYYGLSILNPKIYLVATCLICCITSLATGSSWTTAGTVGIALIGVGSGLGVPMGVAAGAVISGAYFGDKMSPLSDTTNVAPVVAGSELFEHIKHMVWTVTPALIISLILYAILGMGYQGQVDMSTIVSLQKGILNNFNVTPILLLPPVITIILVARKFPAIPSMLAGILLGILSAMIFQGVSIADIPVTIHYGFSFVDFEQVMPALSDLLQRGGMDSMMWTINLIICAMCYGGVLEATGILHVLAEGIIKYIKGRAGVVTLTVFTCIFVNIVTGDQYLAILLPGSMYRESFEDLKLKPKNLSRCLEDAGTVTSNLVPWNTCGAYMYSLFGIAAWGAGGYGPYAFLCLLCPVISIIYGITGFTMEKMTDEEYEKVLSRRESNKAAAIAAMAD